MGNIFCECNKRDELNFSESNKSLLSKEKVKEKRNDLALIDINKDKYIDYEEFKTMMIRIIE